MEKVRCRVCGHGEAASLGQIPDSGEFAGQQINPAIKGGWLWRCKDCGSMFRYPTLTSSEYISLYEKAPSTVWVEDDVERNDFASIYKFLKNHVGGSILDVGCYSGNFLAGLPDKFKKYGIEPSELAASSAISKGIDVLGKTMDELDSTLIFDVVVSIDVIEHVLDVEKFLSQALAHVRENGLLIISTGNPDCFFWKKVFKSKFWYNSFAEHVTFPSYDYFSEFSERNGLHAPEQMRFRYTRLNLMARLLMLLRFSFAYAAYKTLGTIRRVIAGNAIIVNPFAHVSLIGVFTDHHVIILKKGNCNGDKGHC
jgi:SAM-dependent methyltransferase